MKQRGCHVIELAGLASSDSVVDSDFELPEWAGTKEPEDLEGRCRRST